MSKLTEKINSYAIQKGIEFGSTGSWPETETGSYPQTVASDWLLQNNFGTASILGPTGQEPDDITGYRKSRLVNYDTSRRARLGITSTNFGQAFVDNNYSMGFWVKLRPFTYVAGSNMAIWQQGTPALGGFSLWAITNSEGLPELTTFAVFFSQSPGFQTFQDPDTGNDAFIIDKWYYFAFIRQGSNLDVYINGKFVNTITGFATGPITSILFGGSGITGTSPDYRSFNISNFYVAEPSVIGATEIAEIWNAGNTAKIINYYDGSAWEQAYAETVWDGTEWVADPDTKYYDGSTWVDIPEYDQTYV